MPDPKKEETADKNSTKHQQGNQQSQTGQANVKFRDIDFEAGYRGDIKKNKNKNKSSKNNI